MKIYHLIILIIIVGFGVSFRNLQAQHVLLSAGGNNTGSGGTVSYSLGQLATEKGFGGNGTVNPGVQHPYEITVVTGTDIQNIELNIKAFPNPVHTFLLLQFDPLKYSNPGYRIYDLSGKCIAIKNMLDSPTTIDMKERIPSTYILKIFDGKNEIKSFKIIKN